MAEFRCGCSSYLTTLILKVSIIHFIVTSFNTWSKKAKFIIFYKENDWHSKNHEDITIPYFFTWLYKYIKIITTNLYVHINSIPSQSTFPIGFQIHNKYKTFRSGKYPWVLCKIYMMIIRYMLAIGKRHPFITTLKKIKNSNKN